MKRVTKIVILLILFLSFAELFVDFGCANPLSRSSSANLLVHFIDAGYGDSILIEFPDGKNMLIDGGNQEAGGRVVEYLKKRGVKKLDTVIITHPHPDHIQGIFSVMAEFDINTVLANEDISESESYMNLFKEIKKKNIKYKQAVSGDTIDKFREVKIKILHPAGLTGNPNNDSLVIKLTYKKVSFLFTSDIGRLICGRLAEYYKEELKSAVLQIPHHGKSGTEFFFTAVSPEIAVISVGQSKWRNIRLEEETRNKLEKMGVRVLSTDSQGSITLESDGEEVWR